MINYVELIRNHTSSLHMVRFPTLHSQIQSQSWDTRNFELWRISGLCRPTYVHIQQGPWICCPFVCYELWWSASFSATAWKYWMGKQSQHETLSILLKDGIYIYSHTRTYISPFAIGTASVLECCHTSVRLWNIAPFFKKKSLQFFEGWTRKKSTLHSGL